MIFSPLCSTQAKFIDASRLWIAPTMNHGTPVFFSTTS
jgi:hypothetical protein